MSINITALVKGNKSQHFDEMGLTELIKSNNNHILNVSGLPEFFKRKHGHRKYIDYAILETE